MLCSHNAWAVDETGEYFCTNCGLNTAAAFRETERHFMNEIAERKRLALDMEAELKRLRAALPAEEEREALRECVAESQYSVRMQGRLGGGRDERRMAYGALARVEAAQGLAKPDLRASLHAAGDRRDWDECDRIESEIEDAAKGGG